jgi:hypothetical protein
LMPLRGIACGIDRDRLPVKIAAGVKVVPAIAPMNGKVHSMLPADITDRLRSDFPDDDEYDLALSVLSDLAEEFDARIVRCVVHLTSGDLDRLSDADKRARDDSRGVVASAEYDGAGGEQLRDFSKPFHDEPDDGLSPGYLKSAMKAFKKRLKLYRLDSESGIGGSGLSGGKVSGIVAIRPPTTFPQEVWAKLVEQGRLREVDGAYEIVG